MPVVVDASAIVPLALDGEDTALSSFRSLGWDESSSIPQQSPGLPPSEICFDFSAAFMAK
jgi:hypothetical protein